MKNLRTRDITLHNYQDVYEYYKTQRANEIAVKLAHFMMRTCFKPSVSFDDRTLTDVHKNLADKQPIIMAANHVRYVDQYVTASAIGQIPTIAELATNSITYAKSPYFQTPAQRLVTESIGGVPVFRKKEFEYHPTEKPPIMELGRAGLMLIDITIERMKTGQNLFMFPEGTRNLEDWSQVMPLEKGIGVLSCKAAQAGVPISILPIGISYEDKSRKSGIAGHVHFGRLIKAPFDNPSILTDRLHNNLQQAVDISYERFKS